MNHEDFRGLLGIDQPEAFVDRVCETIADVYRFDADRYEEDYDDLQVFGFSVYRHIWRRLEENLSTFAGVRTARPRNSLEITVSGGLRFHVYRGGVDSSFDILSYDLTTGTETKASLPERNALQLSLFGDADLEVHNKNLRELVIVHAGNPQDQLTGIWVGAPLSGTLNGSQWAWVLPLYNAADGQSSGRLSPHPTPIRPFDSIEEPHLDIALHSDDVEGEG